MRIYSNEATWSTIFDAAAKAGVSLDRSDSFTPQMGVDEDGKRTVVEFASGFDVILSGDSRRRQNRGENNAATWDQWGVFLSWILHIDNDALIGSRKRPYYRGSADFDYRTGYRFSEPGEMPADAHGDHTFRFDNSCGQHRCTKCSATQAHNW